MNLLKDGGINNVVCAIEVSLSEEVFGIILGKPANNLMCLRMQAFYGVCPMGYKIL